MRILGPDGKPLSVQSPLKEEVRQIVAQATAQADAGDPASALQLMVAAFQHDVSSDLVLDTTIRLLNEMMQMTGADESEERQLFQDLKDHRDDPERLYRIGTRFFQLQQPQVARPFLARARELGAGQNPELAHAIDIDYAQTLMDLGEYQQAIDGFHDVNDKHGGLPIWMLFEMAECYALLGEIDEADEVFKIAPPEAAAQVENMEEIRDEVGDLLARVRDFEGRGELGLREWHYVQTRGMLLELNADPNIPGQRYIFHQPTDEQVARLVGTAAALLDERSSAPQQIAWLGPSSEPLARLFAEWWELPDEAISEYTPDHNSDEPDPLTLLVLAHSDDIMAVPDEEQFFHLAEARAGMILFALDLRYGGHRPMTPDIAGFMSQQCILPWESHYALGADGETAERVDETRDPKTIASDIARQFPEEEECDRAAEELQKLYETCTDLIIDHRDGSLIRRPLVGHSPIKSPRVLL